MTLRWTAQPRPSRWAPCTGPSRRKSEAEDSGGQHERPSAQYCWLRGDEGTEPLAKECGQLGEETDSPQGLPKALPTLWFSSSDNHVTSEFVEIHHRKQTKNSTPTRRTEQSTKILKETPKHPMVNKIKFIMYQSKTIVNERHSKTNH